MWWWWWGWVALIVIFLALPWGYGWSRRGWGPPYPSYYRRRYTRVRPYSAVAPESGDVAPGDPVSPHTQRTATVAPPGTERDTAGAAWSWLADLLWLGVLAAIGWAVYLWVT